MTLATITRRYHFEAAHWLPHVPEGHKCRRMHGHNYEIEIEIGGPVGAQGWIKDFFDLDAVVLPLIARLDHRCLNDIEGLENPTAELIGAWFHHQLGDLRKVRVFETKDCWADVFAG